MHGEGKVQKEFRERWSAAIVSGHHSFFQTEVEGSDRQREAEYGKKSCPWLRYAPDFRFIINKVVILVVSSQSNKVNHNSVLTT